MSSHQSFEVYRKLRTKSSVCFTTACFAFAAHLVLALQTFASFVQGKNIFICSGFAATSFVSFLFAFLVYRKNRTLEWHSFCFVVSSGGRRTDYTEDQLKADFYSSKEAINLRTMFIAFIIISYALTIFFAVSLVRSA